MPYKGYFDDSNFRDNLEAILELLCGELFVIGKQ